MILYENHALAGREPLNFRRYRTVRMTDALSTMKKREEISLTNKGIEIAAASISSLSSSSPKGSICIRATLKSHSYTLVRRKTVPNSRPPPPPPPPSISLCPSSSFVAIIPLNSSASYHSHIYKPNWPNGVKITGARSALLNEPVRWAQP